jgi:hemoglobin
LGFIKAKENSMEKVVLTFVSRRSVMAGLGIIAAPMSIFSDMKFAQAAQTTPEKTLYERLGGVFAIAAVVDHFSDAIVKNPIVGQKSKNPQLREWHTKSLGRLPGLKFMRTLWVCEVSGGPFKFAATKPGSTPLGLEEAHRDLKISPAEFDEVAAELGRTLDVFKVPKPEKAEVLAAFAAHKNEVTAGYSAAN